MLFVKIIESLKERETTFLLIICLLNKKKTRPGDLVVPDTFERFRFIFMFIFGTHPVIFGTNPVIFGTNPVTFETNPVVFGTNPVIFGTNPVVFGINQVVFSNI